MYFKTTLHLKELNDFLTGFASWQKDITAKDRQLIQSAKENQVKFWELLCLFVRVTSLTLKHCVVGRRAYMHLSLSLLAGLSF